MAEVHVNRFETQYRLPAWAFGEQRRLDQVRTRVLEKAFAQAFDESSMPEDGEVCIRNLIAPVRLRLSVTDEALTNSWSLAIADEITRALRDGASNNIVFFHSRRQALLDLAIGTARGDLRRIWVWRQLGLWHSRDGSDQSQAQSELVAALCAESALLVPTLLALADAGWLGRIVHRLTEEQWEKLASAALQEVGAIHLLEESRDAPSSRTVRDALRVLKRSQLLWAVTSTGSLAHAGPASGRAAAALAVLEVEPMLLSTPTAAAMISIIAEAVRAPRNELIQSPSEPGKPQSTWAESSERDVKDRGKPPSSGQSQAASAWAAEQESANPRTIHVKQLQPAGEFRSAADSGNVPAEEERKPIDLRRRALTRFGGLIFLLGIIGELNLPEEILHDAVLGLRPFAWVIHQLGLALITMEENDPAALAFAGLPPRAIPPSEEEGLPSETEVDALKLLVSRIVERLSYVLEREDEPEGTLVDFVCGRRAEVVADPGWIELRFSLDDVATEIRRAGLDLDPGYVPWLGIVVKFVYE